MLITRKGEEAELNYLLFSMETNNLETLRSREPPALISTIACPGSFISLYKQMYLETQTCHILAKSLLFYFWKTRKTTVTYVHHFWSSGGQVGGWQSSRFWWMTRLQWPKCQRPFLLLLLLWVVFCFFFFFVFSTGKTHLQSCYNDRSSVISL